LAKINLIGDVTIELLIYLFNILTIFDRNVCSIFSI